MVRAKEVSPSELVELYLERIASLDPELNAYRVVLAEGARADAKRAEERLAKGDDAPLLGVPVAIKDNVDYAGEVTTHGTAAYGEPAAEDGLDRPAACARPGATILGKTNLPELAIYGFTESPTWGDTRNPWDTSRTCGGSSGGSGVATAAGMCAIAHATDGAGSIRYPAAFNGLFGLKPQRNRISLSPDREHWYGLSVAGCVSRTVMDTALYLDAMSGPEKGDFESPPPFERPLVEAARTPPGKLRIACTTKTTARCKKAPRCWRPTRRRSTLLRSLGHEVTEASPPLQPRAEPTSSRCTSAESATRRSACRTRSGSRTRPRASSACGRSVQRPPACARSGTGCPPPPRRSRALPRLRPAAHAGDRTAAVRGREAARKGRTEHHERDGQRLSVRRSGGTTPASRRRRSRRASPTRACPAR